MSDPARADLVIRARRVLLNPTDWIADGGLLVRGGKVSRVLRSPSAVRRARAKRVVDCDGLLAPGLVNAHAHLELEGLAGLVPGSDGFTGWVGALLRERAGRRASSMRRDARAGAARLLAGGTTAVGDVDTTGAGLAAALAGGERPRTVLYREVLDAGDPGRTRAALDAVRRAPPRRRDVREGISPHAPFTVSPPLLLGAARVATRRDLPVAVHWSESEDERAWLEEGTGPLARVLARSPRRAGLDLLDEAGLLGPRTTLIHGNLPRRGEPGRLARAGVALVHCPGTHAFFDRAPFPIERYRRAGVSLALGTDSSASNEDLDMRREMALTRAAFPWLSPRSVWAMATVNAARALGLAGEVGELRPGAWADVVEFAADAETRRGALEELTAGLPEVLSVAIGGRFLAS